MAQESDEHRDWREEFERQVARHQAITHVASQLIVSHIESSPAECWERAEQFVDIANGATPTKEGEPPFSDEAPPSTRPEPLHVVTPTPSRTQGNLAGFLPQGSGPSSVPFRTFNPR